MGDDELVIVNEGTRDRGLPAGDLVGVRRGREAGSDVNELDHLRLWAGEEPHDMARELPVIGEDGDCSGRCFAVMSRRPVLMPRIARAPSAAPGSASASMGRRRRAGKRPLRVAFQPVSRPDRDRLRQMCQPGKSAARAAMSSLRSVTSACILAAWQRRRDVPTARPDVSRDVASADKRPCAPLKRP